MKFIELKDLNQGDNIILAWRDDHEYWWPYEVEVHKEKGVEFYDVYEQDLSIPLREFFTLYKDIFGNRIFEVVVFDSVDECQNYCNFENNMRHI